MSELQLFVLMHYDDKAILTIPISCIQIPRKCFTDYLVGDHVQAKCPGYRGVHGGTIKGIDSDRDLLKKQGDELRRIQALQDGSGVCVKASFESSSGARAVDTKQIETTKIQEKKTCQKNNSVERAPEKKRKEICENVGDAKKLKIVETSQKNKSDVVKDTQKKRKDVDENVDEESVPSKTLECQVQKDLAESLLKRMRTSQSSKESASIDHKDCVSRKEFLELKEDVRRLRRKVQNLENMPSPSPLPPLPPLHMLQTHSPSHSPLPPSPFMVLSPKITPQKPANLQQIPLSPSILPLSSTENSARGNQESLYNGLTTSNLEDSIGHLDKLYDGVKVLLLKLFPEEYISSHSVSGKASNKQTSAKPIFDYRLYGIMVTVLKKKFGSTDKDITEKVHSVQKFVKKRN